MRKVGPILVCLLLASPFFAMALEGLVEVTTGRVVVAKPDSGAWSSKEYDGTNCISGNGLWVWVRITNAAMQNYIAVEMVAVGNGLELKAAAMATFQVGPYPFQDTNGVERIKVNVAAATNHMETTGAIPYDTNFIYRVAE